MRLRLRLRGDANHISCCHVYHVISLVMHEQGRQKQENGFELKADKSIDE